ncbi:MAG: hypothetical protein MUD03_05465 [Pirellula sp.]|jgi:hypothetical protein|nr:hypothetical protein [Pirellula sp.]
MTTAREKFEIISELFEMGRRAFIQKQKMKYPHITEEELDRLVQAWLRDRPGAEFGDGDGIPGDMKRFEKCND